MNIQSQPLITVEDELVSKLASYDNNDEAINVCENDSDEQYFVLGYN